MPDADYSWIANLSPYVATVAGTVVTILGILWYRNKRYESREKTAAQSQLDAIQEGTVGTGTRIAQVDTKIINVENKVEALHSTLSHHVKNEDYARDEQTVVLREIHKQLVGLNAGLTGSVINQENAKLIISYQWNWCRDETIRVALRSIKDNHFRGNEAVVARNVYRGWNKASKDALDSLQKIQGIKYPYGTLFLRHIDFIGANIWNWCVPLYYEKRAGNFDDKLTDLASRITALFDLVHSIHIDVAEDVAFGALYREEHPVKAEVIFDEATATRMGERLRNYASDEDSSLVRVHTPESVRVVVKANIDDMYKRRSAGEVTPLPPTASA